MRGIGHKSQKQGSFLKLEGQHRYSYGGVLRQKRKGRGQRPLSTKESIHLVFKLDPLRLKHRSLRSPQVFLLSQKIIQSYAKRFFVKVEQISIQHNHIHLLIRTSKRSLYQYFFRVVAGQIAQRLEKAGLLAQVHQVSRQSVTDTPPAQGGKSKTSFGKARLWIYRPFTRVVRGHKAYKIVVEYIRLNEFEVRGLIRYSKQRLKGLSSAEWIILRQTLLK